MLRRVRVLVVLASLAGALSVGAAGASAANWAGLGDSYAAGPLIPNQQLNPLGCLRSDHNFAHLAAAALGRSLADASCSGAKTDDMTAPQDVTPGPANPPQFNALTSDTQIVTLQIGGNDIGFTSILENCATANPFAHPCRDKYVVNGHDTLADKIAATAPKVAAVLQGIHTALAQRARLRRQLRGDPARDRQRLLAAGPDRRSPTCPTCAASRRTSTRCSPSRRPPTAHGSSTTTPPASAATRASRRRRAGSSRWCPANAAAPFHPNARGEAGIAAVVVSAVSS